MAPIGRPDRQGRGGVAAGSGPDGPTADKATCSRPGPPLAAEAMNYKRGEIEALAMTPDLEWFVTLRIQVARAGVGFALLLGLLGSVMTFVPGYQAEWLRRSRRSLDRDVVPNQVDARPSP